ncbi:MAG: NADH-quinone oxidoreductase subunit L [Deltaproteobacteria bacterium]|nr:MAG: NADH-quinone oxidoreductase subunit L [Deltaproteobacteria bacterium]
MAEKLFSLIYLVPLLPLLGAFVNGAYAFSGAKLVRPFVHTIALAAIFIPFLITVGAFLHVTSLPEESRQVVVTFFPWLDVGSFKANVEFLIDPLSLTLMLVITGIGSLIHLYSVGYMSHEPSYARYFTYLNLFCFAMLILVMGSNVPMMFIGWEGVGLCSYLLIGFWFTDSAKAAAGMKAFVVNRVGDFAFIVGFLLLYWTLQSKGHATVQFVELRNAVTHLDGVMLGSFSLVTIVCVLMFIGATGKSAQIPLYVWLPDAMAGPTPVSALIHAATMVTAGVYMIGRMSYLFSMSPAALNIIATVGFVTALFAAIIGFTQNDIKKVLAYSTVSQLGYMFGAMGVAAYTAGVFHLLTHAFFKACLFLGSGSVIHAMSGEQDIQKMGALRKHLPITHATFFLSTLAIAGIFPFSGFFSKDEILWHAFNHSKLLWLIGVTAAAGTAVYMLRMVTLTFYGESRVSEEAMHHLHESPLSMTIPLMVLAFLAVFGGFLGVPESLGHFFGLHESNLLEHWLEPSLVFPKEALPMASHATEYFLMVFSLGIAISGCLIGFVLYTKRKDIPESLAQKYPKVYEFIYNKYYVDEFYKAVFVNNLLRLNDFLALFDQKVIDGIVNGTAYVTKIVAYVSGWVDRTFVDGLVNLTASVTSFGGIIARRFQTGRIQTYLYLALGAILVIVFYRFG